MTNTSSSSSSFSYVFDFCFWMLNHIIRNIVHAVDMFKQHNISFGNEKKNYAEKLNMDSKNGFYVHLIQYTSGTVLKINSMKFIVQNKNCMKWKRKREN